jgi:hypothetical protein
VRVAAAVCAAAAAVVAAPAQAQTLEPPPPLGPQAPAYPPPTYVPGEPTSGPMTGSTASGPRNADDEKKDSGLGLEWVWIDADLGGAYVGLDSINKSNLQIQSTKSGGVQGSVAAGVRLLFFTLGLRARDLFLSNLSLWELDGEAAFHTRIDHFDPYIGVRGGYAFNGSLGSGATEAFNGATPSGVSLHGWNVGPMLGCEYYFNHFVSVGLELNVEFLFLERPPVQPPAALTDPALQMGLTPMQMQQAQQLATAYRASGSSVGFGAIGSVRILGVHF